MSKRSKIVEKILEKNHREYMDDADAAEEHLKERSAVEDETYKIPKKSITQMLKARTCSDARC